ncbi:MAG TPA: TadE/TadG family type IV pilus assembly protein [Allosphingosinicella sp.]|jgi:Flp pilus assembly protein TadG
MRSLNKHARALRQDERGSSIIELALALPFLSVMLLGLIDVATCYSEQMSIQQAAARSLERVQTSGATTDFTYVRAEAAAAADVPLSQVAVDSWLECNNVRQAASVQACTGTQVSAKYVQVTITSTYAPYFRYSPLGGRQSDGKVALSASSAVRYG